jgi:septum formation protein
LARTKAQKVAAQYPGKVILAADTVVSARQEILGKPRDADDARRILCLLSGTTHRVITAVTVIWQNNTLSRVVASTVEMRPLQPDEIEAYLATGQWRGKAGAYGIQDHDPFVKNMGGCLTNIVGLPMTTTQEMLRLAGIHAKADMR